MKINIKDKEIEIKYSIRALLAFENITDKTFSPSTMNDIITFMYCIILTSSKDYSLSYDEFIDWLDENPSTFNDMADWLTSTIVNQSNLKKK